MAGRLAVAAIFSVSATARKRMRSVRFSNMASFPSAGTARRMSSWVLAVVPVGGRKAARRSTPPMPRRRGSKVKSASSTSPWVTSCAACSQRSGVRIPRRVWCFNAQASTTRAIAASIKCALVPKAPDRSVLSRTPHLGMAGPSWPPTAARRCAHPFRVVRCSSYARYVVRIRDHTPTPL